MKLLNRLLLASLFIIPHYSATASEIEAITVPDWVNVKPLSFEYDVPKEQLRDGVYYLLVDSQSKIEKNGDVTHYSRTSVHIDNPSGVEGSSQVDFSYDPSYEKINLHSMRVWRQGKAINKLATARVSILQQEDELDNLIYNGTESINFVLDDIRVGDVLDYSYSISGQNPVYSGIYSQTNSLQWSVPVLSRVVRLLWFKDKPLQIKQYLSKIEVNEIRLKEGVEYSIYQNNVKPLQSDGTSPSWFNKYPFIEFSETKSWKEIVDWGLPLFQMAISQDSSIQSLANKIKQKSNSKSEQLLNALHYVQQEIRYLGIEIGENSHKPSVASETLKRRYGDCKDKTVLLISILKALDIKSSPALVNTDLSDELVNRLPKPGAFDHVIVKAYLDDKTYWLDPTRKYQNFKLDKVFQPDFDQALVIDEKTNSLEDIKVNPDITFQKTVEEFALNKDYEKPIKYTSTSIMSGLDAENSRYSLANKGLSSLKKSYFSYYKNYYSDLIKDEPLTFTELENGNRKSTESYIIKNFWEKDEDDSRYLSWFYANTISGYLSRKNSKNREDPLAISYPVNLEQIIKVKFDDDGWDFSSEKLQEDNEFFYYSRAVSYDKEERLLTLSYQYKTKQAFVPSSKLVEYDAILEKLDDDTTYGIYRGYNVPTDTSSEDNKNLTTTVNNYNQPIFIVIAVYLVLIAFSIVLWRVDSKRNPYLGEMIMYPVTPLKFIVLSFLTFGIFSSYWIYKNFKYFKIKYNEEIMPIARGIFDYLWFYPLYKRMFDDSVERFDKNLLPPKIIGCCLALVYFLLIFVDKLTDLTFLMPFIGAIIVLPLIVYVNRVNQDNTAAIKHNSKWSLRHNIVALISVPLIVISMGSFVRVLPADYVIAGNDILSYDLKYLQRKGVVDPGDEIQYFYSDAVLFIRNDGNGFTDKHVFSYWVDERSEFKLKRMDYAEIQDIEVTWSKSAMDNTIVKVTASDDSSMLLFVSTDKKLDKVFVNTLKSKWYSAKKTVS